MSWWRRLVGSERLHQELMDARRRACAAEIEARNLRKLCVSLVEPGGVASCRKVRLRSHAEADGFARMVEQQTGQVEGALEAYRCRRCPRQPVSGGCFWHVTHRRGRERGAQRVYRRGLGGFDRAQLDAVRERLGAA